MSHTIEIRLLMRGAIPLWAERLPLAGPGEEEPDLDPMEDEQLTELVLGRVRDYVTHELL